MAWPTIRKSSVVVAAANLGDDPAARRRFSWAAERAAIAPPDGRLNMAQVAVDRHLALGRGEHAALRCLGKDGAVRILTYRQLSQASSRFANLLRRLDVGAGERVFLLLGRVPELYAAALGTLKHGAVFCPLFSAFGPEPVRTRMEIGEAAVLVTTEAHYRRKVLPWRQAMPGLRHVILVGGGQPPPGTIGWEAALQDAPDDAAVAPTGPDDMAILHFTSGTTGRPKGAVHVHDAVVGHYATAKYALDLKPDDTLWCTADPGWVTGTSYGIIGPLAVGATLIVDEAEFEAEHWYDVLERQKVTVWYTSPTAIRMLMKAGPEVARRHELGTLRFAASVGEPLNPEAVIWGQEVLGLPYHDNWWQTETGGIMIANLASMDIKPGSMGRPLPGIEAAIVVRGPDSLRVNEAPMSIGELALRPDFPSMFRGYLKEEERYRKCFADGWYLTGDLAMRDADGYFWFVGRGDDVIKSSGHLIGPFEVESALMEHPAVAEAGVIGKPDPVAGEVVKAFVALKQGHIAGEALRKELLGHARKRLGPAVAPKEIDFRDNLPKTRSGKIMRRLLKARELGLPEGDLSSLESDER